MEGVVFENSIISKNSISENSISETSTENNLSMFIETSEEYIKTFIMNKIMENTSVIDIILTVDRSGSMGTSLSYKAQNKMNIVVNAIKSCIQYLQTLINKGKNIRLSLIAFDEESELIVDACTNPSDEISKIETALLPSSATDIGKAIDMTNEHIKKLALTNNITNIHAIILTDGYHNSKTITSSEIENKFKLCEFIDCYSGIGIGQITDYDSTFLMNMFTKFSGAPTNNELYDTIIGNVFNATSIIYSDFQIEITNINNSIICSPIISPMPFKDGIYKSDSVDFSQKFYFTIKNIDTNSYPKVKISYFNKITELNEVLEYDMKLKTIMDDKIYKLCGFMDRFTKITEITTPTEAINETKSLLNEFTQMKNVIISVDNSDNEQKMNSIQKLINANIEIVENHLSELTKYEPESDSANFLNYSAMNKRQINNTVSGGRILSVSRGYSDNLSQTYQPPTKYIIT